MSASENIKSSLLNMKASRKVASEIKETGSILTNLISGVTTPRAPGMLNVPNAGLTSYDYSRRLSDIEYFNAKQRLQKETSALYHQIEHRAAQTGQTPEVVKGIMLESVTEEHQTAMNVLELNHVTSQFSSATLALQSEYEKINNQNTADYKIRVSEHERKRQNILSSIGTMATLITLI